MFVPLTPSQPQVQTGAGRFSEAPSGTGGHWVHSIWCYFVIVIECSWLVGTVLCPGLGVLHCEPWKPGSLGGFSDQVEHPRTPCSNNVPTGWEEGGTEKKKAKSSEVFTHGMCIVGSFRPSISQGGYILMPC